MGKPRIVKNMLEADKIINRYWGDKHMLMVAVTQLVEREKIRVINNYLGHRGEELLPNDPPILPGGESFEWIIDPPQHFYNDIDKPFRKSAPTKSGGQDK